MAENKNALPVGTILNTRYEIEGLLGGGGFGLVYRTRHTHLNTIVAIKELFPRDIVVRQGRAVHPISKADAAIYQKVLSSFRKEGKRLASLCSCSSIVQCSDYFEENGTGYLVMEYIEGRSLRVILRSYRESGKNFSEASLISLLSELLKGLRAVHKAGIQHMDIKPENIYIRETEGADELSNPVLLDFGASRSQTGHSTGSSLLVGTAPYAPIEQMHSRGDMGPWTDIYALGITLYELMFGVDEIPSCMERISDIHSEGVDPLTPAKARDTKQYSECFLTLIDNCIAIKAKDRPQDIEKIEKVLEDEILPKSEVILEHKDPQLQYEQGDMYYYGKGVPTDYEKAIEWYEKAAEQGHEEAQYALGLMYQNGKGVAQDDQQAFEWYRKAAEQGHSDAQNHLGRMYKYGEGVAQDDQKAVEWFRKAAEKGNASAQFNFGWMYRGGWGVPQDDQRAAEWYTKAAEQGLADAQFNLGYSYKFGEGVKRDYKKAFKWYEKAAEQGHASAQYNLGSMYDKGEGVSQDYREAFRWYKKAAEQGNAFAQNNLGSMYDSGEGIGKDDQKAVEWFEKAAEQGHAVAQDNLGVMYAKGKGVPQDFRKAFEWFEKAAEQENAFAQYNLGVMYEYGKGVPKDYSRAGKWYEKAAEQGHADAQNNLKRLEQEDLWIPF